MTSKKILVVEDDNLLMSIFKMSLELDGYQVMNAENGKVALDLLLGLDHASLPDCILLDVMMPVMDGDTFLRVLSESYPEEFGHIPIVVCSAHGKYKTTSQVVAKLVKPIALISLCETMEKVLGAKSIVNTFETYALRMN